MESKEKISELRDGKECEDRSVVLGDDDEEDEDSTIREKRRPRKGHIYQKGHQPPQHHDSHLSRGQSSDRSIDPKIDLDSSSSSQMLNLLDEFTKIYSDRLQRVENNAMKSSDKQYLESKVCVLESWVRDLGEQNAVLVATVEELEKEAADRVALLEDRLSKMAATTRESCVSLRDHQIQVSSLVADKMGLEKEAHNLGDKLVSLERNSMRLKEDNCNLQSDLNNLVQVISRARVTGQWEADDLTFSCVTPEQIFGPVLSSSRRSSQSLKDSQRDYIHQMLEDHMKKDNSSIRSSLSNLQDGDSSIYGSRASEKEVLIMKLKADLRCSQTAHEDINCQLVERDKQIADLQSHLTEMHHELSESQSEVSRLTHSLQELHHQTRHESVEITRKEEVLRHFLYKASKKDHIKGSLTSLCDIDAAGTGDYNAEVQLSENIDILASRLAELEDECQQLRSQHSTLQDTHSLCAPTINMLQDQLSRSQQTQVELRTVLTAEVAERHDQIVSLKDQLKDDEQNHHETQMQLQLRNEVIKDLRKEIRDIRDKLSPSSLHGTKNILAPVEEEKSSCKLETKSSQTQTDQVESLDKGAMTEYCTTSPLNGLYSSAQQLCQVSKLQNELAEKSVLLRELQSHLASSRQEINLKDETLYKVENRNEMLQKMEGENSSLTKILNDKSSTMEKYQSNVLMLSNELDSKKREVTEQRLTINTLQDALVASKRTCDDLRMRLDSDVTSRGSETDRLERDLKAAQTLHHQAITQLVESDARGELLRKENRALSRHVTSIQNDIQHSQSLDARQSDRVSRDRDHLRRQLQEAERRCQDMTTTVQLLQTQIQTLEEEVSSATKARAEAERQASEVQRKNLSLQETLSVQETSESVERLGHQLEETVAALTKAREEVQAKSEQLRQAKQDVSQLSDSLAYEKELNANLHDQMESLMKTAGTHEHKSAEQQQELRRIIRDSMQKDRQISTLEIQVEGLKSQILTLQDLVTEEQNEVTSLNGALAKESRTLQQTRSKLDAVTKESSKGEEQVTNMKKDLQQSQDKIERLELRIKEMESERDTEVAAVAERLTAAHEASIRRLEESLHSYSRLQAHDEFQVDHLEESMRDLGTRLAESELRVKELDRERETISRNLRQEQVRREEDAQEYQRKIMRITEEMTLLKARMETVKEETHTWQRQCEDLEERHQQSEGGSNLQSVLHKYQHQVESLREALMTAKLEIRKAEEERSHAHEQVLSLIRECNNLEEQIHRLTKEKCRLQDQLSCKESDMAMLELDNLKVSSKEDLLRSADRISQLERELMVSKNGKSTSEFTSVDKEMKYLRQQLKESKEEIQKLRECMDVGIAIDTNQNESTKVILQERVTTLTKQLREIEHRETLLKEQIYVQNLGSCGDSGEIMVSQLRSEIASARRESSEARRMLLERESQVRMGQLKIDTLQKMQQDQQQEVSCLEEKLTEAQIEAHRSETEVAHLRSRVATLSSQLSHAQSHKTNSNVPLMPHTEKLEILKDEVSHLKGELAAKTEELNQMSERDNRNVAKLRDLEQEISRITKSRDEAHRKVLTLEGSLAESYESSEATKNLEKMWEAQLANIQQEVSRLLCETSQLKDCNAALHDQLTATQNEAEHQRGEIRSKDSQVEELQHARDLLANDAQVVVAAVKQWLHEQKTANSKLASKLHQQNKHILHLNSEKQYLAERNTSLQRINHELSLQMQDFRVRLGLPHLSTPNEKMNKTGGLSSSGNGGLLSPRLLSPLGGGGSMRMFSNTPPLDSLLGHSSDGVFSGFNDKFEDCFSTCSSEGSSGGGCQVPGPDLPGSLQLERLAHLADSLLLASRSITRNSNHAQGHRSHKKTSATSLDDLSSPSHFNYSFGARPSFGQSRKTSSSVGNLSLLSPIDKPGSPKFRFNDPCLGSKMGSKGSDFILAPPVRERKTSQHLFHTHSIEEAEEEDSSPSTHHGNSSCSNIAAVHPPPPPSTSPPSPPSSSLQSDRAELSSSICPHSQTNQSNSLPNDISKISPPNSLSLKTTTQTLEVSQVSQFGESSA